MTLTEPPRLDEPRPSPTDAAPGGAFADPLVETEVVDPAFVVHEGGKLGIHARTPIDGPEDLALAYSPGVGRVARSIADDPGRVWSYTGRSNAVAVFSNGSAVLGLGDVGPEAAMPVMEGKAVLFKQFADVDAYPICVDARTVDELVAIATALAPTFGGINLEDIRAPECFDVERRLQEVLDIPVFHDDQHGTAIVVLAGLLNAARVVGKELGALRVVVLGAGAAGVTIADLFRHVGIGRDGGDLIGVDRDGIIHRDLPGLPAHQRSFHERGNRFDRRGGIREALVGADVVVGVSRSGLIEPAWLESMADDAIVFALANPVPEVMPDAVPANVAVVATGRSDFPNQVNNVLAFPGVFRGLLDVGATQVTTATKVAAAEALADLVDVPRAGRILPGAFDAGVAAAVAAAVRRTAQRSGHVRR